MSEVDTATEGGGSPRLRRYRVRLALGLAMLLCAAGATAWVAWSAWGPRPTPDDAARQVEPADYARWGVRSIAAVVLCGGVVACAAAPVRRGRPSCARLAMAEIVAGGVTVAAVSLIYWIAWSPLSFVK